MNLEVSDRNSWEIGLEVGRIRPDDGSPYKPEVELRNGTEAVGSYCRFLDRVVIYLRYRI